MYLIPNLAVPCFHSCLIHIHLHKHIQYITKNNPPLSPQPAMQSKYRKLYLYASNTQSVYKKPNQEYQGYKLEKQKSIQHLKLLLDSKVTLPPVASLLAFQGDGNYGELQYRGNEDRSFRVLKSRSKASSVTHKQSFLPSPSRSFQSLHAPSSPSHHPLQMPPHSPKQAGNKGEQRKQNAKNYEKYINQYMQNLQKLNILENYDGEDYSKLVQQACREIRRKIVQEEHQIEEVERSLEESRELGLLALKPGKKKKQKKVKEVRKKGDIVEEPDIYHHFYISNMTDRLFLHRNDHKKSKSVAQNNLYKLNLQQVEKTNALKIKARKRSQKQFVRNLARHSLVQKILPLSPSP